MPFHLLFPLAASVLLVFGTLFTNFSSRRGISTWTLIAVANFGGAICFSSFWLLGGTFPGWSSLWQPAIVAGLYVCGQILMLYSVSVGDVSVALPVASLKVVFVAALLAVFTNRPPSAAVWWAASLATAGVALINYTAPKSDRRVVWRTVLLSLGGAFTFGVFDVVVQAWAPAWGAGRILPFTYWFVGLYSLFLIPLCDSIEKVSRLAPRSTIASGMFVAVQAMCMVFSLATFSDAARINVVYSLRGLWGVLLAWGLSGHFGSNERSLSSRVLLNRVVGAMLLVVAVVIAILNPI